MAVEAEQSLSELERVKLEDPDSEALFVHTLQLVTAVSELILTPVLEDEPLSSDQDPDTGKADE